MRVLFIVVVTLVMLMACNKGKSAPTSAAKVVLEVSGQPKSKLTANEPFQFKPEINYNGTNKLEYAIKNQPEWADFSPVNGTLSGVASSVWVGKYNDISISVTDGKLTHALKPFSIEVTNSIVASISGIPNARVEVDEVYRFLPKIENLSNEKVVIAVENLPHWLVLNRDTGELLGTPKSNDIGIYANINYSIEVAKKKYTLPSFAISVVALSNYVKTRDIIAPEYGNSVPKKGETRVHSITGAKITRLTDATELEGSNDALIVYSRYSPENISGEYFITFGTDSNSSWVIKRENGQVIRKLTNNKGVAIGEKQEVRWHGTTQHPYRVYYVQGMSFWMIEDVRSATLQPTLIRDFSQDFPNSTKIYNDVEGDSSNDSDHWAWMAVHYGENEQGKKTFLVDAFVHYQVSNNQLHRLTPSMLTSTNLDIEKDRNTFYYRPNMVEVTPNGSGVVIHHARKWDDSAYKGQGKNYIGTWFDGAHLWPLDFDIAKQKPVKISISSTHSGWSFSQADKELFISQNNRTDFLDAIAVDGNESGYANRTQIARHQDFGWNTNFHFAKLPPAKKGWSLISTYSKSNNSWGENQLIMIELKNEVNQPTIWRISPTYNLYNGNYRDEASAAINMQGNRVYFTSNWGGRLDHRESFMVELPTNWEKRLKE